MTGNSRAAAARCSHPALGRPAPTLAELRARSDADARAAWDGALALARWREREEARLLSSWDALHDAPCEEVSPRPGATQGVRAIELARALAALFPGCLEGLAVDRFGPRWRARIERARDDVDLDDGVARADRGALAYAWGRRWAWLDRGGAIGLETLLRSVPERVLWALAREDPRARDGLITRGEAYAALCDRLAARGGLGGRVPSVWMARDDVALDERVPGHALVGPPGAGKRALLGQLARRFPGRGVNVDNFHGGGAPDPRYRARPETSYAALSPGLVCAWSAAHRLEPALVEYAVEMAQDAGARFHLVIAATPARWAELVARAPALAALRVIELAAPRDDELLARWICQRPQLEDRVGARLDLAWSLAQLDRLATIAAPAELLRVWLRELGLTSRALYEPGALTRHGLEPALPGARVPRRRLAASRARARLLRGRPWLEPLIPDDAQLDALRELDAAISGDGLRRW